MKKKWEVLARCLLKEGGYYEPRLTPRLLSERYYAGHAVIRETEEEEGERTIFAYAALWPAYHGPRESWYELGSVWIAPHSRGNGLVREVMQETLEKAPGKKFFLISASQGVIQSARYLGFKPVFVPEIAHRVFQEWVDAMRLGERLPTSVFMPVPEEMIDEQNGIRRLLVLG